MMKADCYRCISDLDPDVADKTHQNYKVTIQVSDQKMTFVVFNMMCDTSFTNDMLKLSVDHLCRPSAAARKPTSS